VTARRIHIRSPGVKTGSTIGTLGPFRGTLGIHWVIAAIAIGLVLVLATTYAWVRGAKPKEPYREVGAVESFAPGTAREVLGGIFVGRARDGQPFAVALPAPNCPLEVTDRGYRDCSDLGYGFDGEPLGRAEDPLPRLPLEVYRGEVFVDPTGGDGSF
jgi:hypothetical protein